MPSVDPAGRVLFLIDALPALGDQPSADQLQALRQLIPPAFARLSVAHKKTLNPATDRLSLADQALAQSLGLAQTNLEALAIERACRRIPGALIARLAHWHAARDHIVLRLLDALDTGMRAHLLAAIEADLQEHGWQCAARDDEHGTNGVLIIPPVAWSPTDVVCASSALAEGRNIDLYLPQGPRAREWRRLHNTVQMTWFDHPINQARQARGELAVNALWLEGWTPSAWLDGERSWPSLWTDDPTWRAAWPGPSADRADAQIIALRAPADPTQLGSWWAHAERECFAAGPATIHITGPDRWVALNPARPWVSWLEPLFKRTRPLQGRGLQAWW